MHVKLRAVAGRGGDLASNLLEASRIPMPGCELYIVSTSPSESDAVYVTEVWRTEADHDASLRMDNVRALVARTKPLVAGEPEVIRLAPLGGKGL
jgi:quinol monooxygenase YgiN